MGINEFYQNNSIIFWLFGIIISLFVFMFGNGILKNKFQKIKIKPGNMFVVNGSQTLQLICISLINNKSIDIQIDECGYLLKNGFRSVLYFDFNSCKISGVVKSKSTHDFCALPDSNILNDIKYVYYKTGTGKIYKKRYK